MLLPIAFCSHLTFKVSKVCEGNFGYKAGIYALLLRKRPVYTVTEHPVSGGISKHSQLTGVGAMTSYGCCAYTDSGEMVVHKHPVY